jgi:hypothetical protein
MSFVRHCVAKNVRSATTDANTKFVARPKQTLLRHNVVVM